MRASGRSLKRTAKTTVMIPKESSRLSTATTTAAMPLNHSVSLSAKATRAVSNTRETSIRNPKPPTKARESKRVPRYFQMALPGLASTFQTSFNAVCKLANTVPALTPNVTNPITFAQKRVSVTRACSNISPTCTAVLGPMSLAAWPSSAARTVLSSYKVAAAMIVRMRTAGMENTV